MTGHAKKMSQPNGGIKCIVNTCHYYGSGDHSQYIQEMAEMNHQDIDKWLLFFFFCF